VMHRAKPETRGHKARAYEPDIRISP
jgi:hypothetical protein